MTDQEFTLFQKFIYDAAGISMSLAKKQLVCSRLAKRLSQRGLSSYRDYFQLLASGAEPAETQIAIDLLTTNETYFFREREHFDLLRTVALAARSRAQQFRVWSAAGSTGEEAYSIAMVLADCLGEAPWEVLGTDISKRVLARARTGHYSTNRTEYIPRDYLKRFCLKGIDSEHGTLLVDRSLRSRVRFKQVSLHTELPDLGTFDVIFLRNVMIYFGEAVKREVAVRVLSRLKPGGHLCIGHSESLNGFNVEAHVVAPSIYCKPHA